MLSSVGDGGMAGRCGRESQAPGRQRGCLDLKSWRCRGNSRASVTQFRSRCFPIWVCCCDAAVAEIMSRSMHSCHTKLVTNATFPRRRGPETVALLILPRSLHFPDFGLLIFPPPDLCPLSWIPPPPPPLPLRLALASVPTPAHITRSQRAGTSPATTHGATCRLFSGLASSMLTPPQPRLRVPSQWPVDHDGHR